MPPHARQLHHSCIPCIQQALEFGGEECRFGEYARGVHLVFRVCLDEGEVVAQGCCIREAGSAVEVLGAEDGGAVCG